MKKIIISLGIAIGLVLLISYNVVSNERFFEASITSILTILVALLFSYYFTQQKNDIRKKNEKIDNLIYKIQEIILDSEFIESDNDAISRKNLIKQRSVANKIEYLCNITSTSVELANLVKEIKETFSNYREFYGEHYTDIEYMEKSKKDLLNYVVKIDDLADKIHISLL